MGTMMAVKVLIGGNDLCLQCKVVIRGRPGALFCSSCRLLFAASTSDKVAM